MTILGAAALAKGGISFLLSVETVHTGVAGKTERRGEVEACVSLNIKSNPIVHYSTCTTRRRSARRLLLQIDIYPVTAYFAFTSKSLATVLPADIHRCREGLSEHRVPP